MKSLARIARYLRDRLKEKTTWAGISAAVVGAAGFAAPWNYVLIALGVMGVLVPSKGVATAENA